MIDKKEIPKIGPGQIIADLHIHSKYSRACSKDLDFPNLVKWARIKGINLIGTGDFTHPIWFKEIEKLKERHGIYYYSDSTGEFPFILSSEISLIYTKNGKGRKVHLVYLAPNIEAVKKIQSFLDSRGRRDYDGRPIFGISARDFASKMEELDSRIEIIPAHIWTPWFGLFGSEGGFDKLTDAFEDKSYMIHAIETGISSDPEMNWKIKELDDLAIVSFSDAHSFWPWRFGREATIFNSPKDGILSYDEIIRQIKEKDFFGTIETDPAYGKYHYDGHRNCNFVSSPDNTKKINGICPVCNKSLVVGVEYRVNELQKLGISNHQNKKFFYNMLPLHEIISLLLGLGVASKGCWNVYNDILEHFGTEYNATINASFDEILKVTNNLELTNLIIMNREGRIEVKPGYDGVYGKAIISGKEIEIEGESTTNKKEPIKKENVKLSKISKKDEQQKKLF